MHCYMKNTNPHWSMNSLTFLFALFVCANLFADEPLNSQFAIKRATTSAADLALQPGGIIHGQLTDSMGQSRPNTPIALILLGTSNKQLPVVASSTSDEKGRFMFRSIRPGSYELRTNSGRRVVRLWAIGIAPPSADQTVHVVDQSQVVRGQGILSSSFATPESVLFFGMIGLGAGLTIAIAETGS